MTDDDELTRQRMIVILVTLGDTDYFLEEGKREKAVQYRPRESVSCVFGVCVCKYRIQI